MPIRQRLMAIPLLPVLMLSACGGDGGSSAPGTAAPSEPGIVLGSRTVPGYAVEVTRFAVSASATLQVRVQVTPDAGVPLPASVLCWTGAGYEPPVALTPTTPVAGASGQYDAILALPEPRSAEQALWVRLNCADGSMREAGRDAFPIR